MVKVGCLIVDIVVGMYVYSSIFLVLLLCECIGEGSCIDVLMLESLVEWMGYLMYYVYQDVLLLLCVGVLYLIIYFYGLFFVGDGGIVMFGLQNECEWWVFCDKVLCCLELVDDECFLVNFKCLVNCEELCVLIVEVFVVLLVVEVVVCLEQVQIVNVYVNDMVGVWVYLQLQVW